MSDTMFFRQIKKSIKTELLFCILVAVVVFGTTFYLFYHQGIAEEHSR